LSALSGEHQPVSSLTLAGEPPAAPRFAVNLTPLSLLMRAFFCPLFDSPLSSRAALRSATRRDWSGLPSSVTSSRSAIFRSSTQFPASAPSAAFLILRHRRSLSGVVN
ncbi:hypothetical protein GOODEAATRI_030170, partial [Goodea atripinnis]